MTIILWIIVVVVVVVCLLAGAFLLILFLPDPRDRQRPRKPLQQLPWPPPTDPEAIAKQPAAPTATREALMDEVAGLIEGLRKPAILVRATTSGGSHSHFGGTPTVPRGFQWPRNQGLPMAFIASIDLAELPPNHGLDFLPVEGVLSFFMDLDNGGGGYRPEDATGFQVAYYSGEREILTEPPFPMDLSDDYRFVRRPMVFMKTKLPPDWEMKEMIGLFQTDEQDEAYLAYRDSFFGGKPRHQIGGYVSAIQSPEMELDCQMLSHGFRVGSKEFKFDPRCAELAQHADEWRLLFQFDHDPYQRISRGEPGTSYFWVHKDEALAGRFERCWLISQCT